MPRSANPAPPPDPLHDPLLAAVPTIEGYKVLGKTILLDVIGTGGMGVVYRGWHMTFHIDVAVKVLQKSLAEDRDYVRRFRREAQAALKITHQNVVRAYDVEELHGLHFFVMEFVDGESAWQRVGRLGRLSLPAAHTVFVGAATGLAEAHAHGLVHRDVKPGNLLIARSGRVKLADLGLVHPAIDDDEPAGRGGDGSSRLLGTPQYLAPEQWDGAPAQPTADVWALGATLYYLTTGRHGLPRLPKAELKQLVRDEPFPTLTGVLRPMPELNAIFERCVSRDPAARFAHAGELCQALQALGPGDEELLREGAPAGAAVGKSLPPNEVLGRIDMYLKGRAPSPAPAAPSVAARSAPAAVVVAPRRRHLAAPPRRGVSGILILVVLAVAAILGSLFYLNRRAPPREVPPTTEERGAVERAPSPPPPQPTPAPPAPQPTVTPSKPAPTAPKPAPAATPVEAAAPEPATVSRSPRETLQAWLTHSGDAGHLPHLTQHRAAVRAAREALGEDPQAIAASLAPLDEAMVRFPAVEAGSVPQEAVDGLLVTVGAWRRAGQSIEPLLPWLLLLQKNDAADPGVAFCVFEAWAVDGLGAERARAAAADVQTLLAMVADSEAPSRARLPEVVFELGSLGDDGAAVLAHVLRQVVAERLPAGAIGPLAVRQAFVPELESRYEKAMQAGAFDAAARALQTIHAIDPNDRGAEVVLAMVLGHRDGITFDHAVLAPEEQAAVHARARRLGMTLLAPQLDVSGVLAALGDASTAQFPFFVTGLESDRQEKQALVDQLTADINGKQAEERKARAGADNEQQRAVNYQQINATAAAKAQAEAKRLRAVAADLNEEVQRLRKEQEQAKKDLRQLDAALRDLTRKRGEFRLQ